VLLAGLHSDCFHLSAGSGFTEWNPASRPGQNPIPTPRKEALDSKGGAQQQKGFTREDVPKAKRVIIKVKAVGVEGFGFRVEAQFLFPPREDGAPGVEGCRGGPYSAGSHPSSAQTGVFLHSVLFTPHPPK
jgi:hypothetical protein